MRLQRWDAALTTGDTNALLREIASILLSRILDEETRRELRHLVDSDDFLALSDWSVDYVRLSVADVLSIRQLQAFFQKRKDLGDDVAREINALKSFREAEQLCSESNNIFRAWSRGSFQFSPDVEAVLFSAQRKIARVLGDVPRLEDLHIRFGPGSTTSVQKRDASARKKLAAPFACSGDLSATVSECLEEMPAWVFDNFEDVGDASTVTVEIHPGRLIFVPKNRKTFRAIGPEPMLNGMFQLGIGSYMDKRLKRFGVDIHDQSRNQKLAWLGSINGELATLDLSSASDCISIGLVEHLLPHDWVTFLSRFRTGIMEYGDQVIKLEKFSTMGNGFTFPLETLIFWALALGVCESKEERDSVSVYGDDIIVPAHRYALLVRVLTACGFLINLKKSFADGPFRESCGADYLSGINIRPYYLDDRLTGESAFGMYNFFQRRFDDEICGVVLNCLDPTMILWGPDGYGDGHLIGDHPMTPHPKNSTHGYSGFTFETYTWKPRRCFKLLPGDRVLPCYSIYLRGSSPLEDSLPLPGDFAITSVCRRHVGFDLGLFEPEVGLSISYRKGKLGVVLPGKQGYRRMKIYTFA